MRTLTLLSLILSAGCLRLPKWLHNPLQLTNIPLLPAMDLGRPCFSGGEEGVCTLPRQGRFQKYLLCKEVDFSMKRSFFQFIFSNFCASWYSKFVNLVNFDH